MANVRYVGPHDAVVVALPLGGEDVVARGDVLKTSDEHAASLCEQVNNWERVVAESKLASPAKKPVEPEEKE